jgi:hypothetical protein
MIIGQSGLPYFLRVKGGRRLGCYMGYMAKVPTKWVGVVTVCDPDTGLPVQVEIRKDMESGAMVGIDCSFLESDVGPVYSPYNYGSVLEIPDNEI